ncbi:hypothetical protein CFC21_003690 [Triticum aestivum]|uniref:Uncharacterized protein n=1 Tax=Triticum aestivum TaxID=4565 RepID=A0A3B5Y4Z3_WHEAT|nr:hypothetical protein CFC21_003690 [Triticum aestivum]
MAMAALRCAAGRRLAGGGRLLPPALSRLRPAAPGLGRPNLTLTQALSSHGKEEAGREVLEQIQEKKERLYDLILRHGYKRNDGSMCYSNVQLMHHLSAHIKPRPQSIAWYSTYFLCPFFFLSLLVIHAICCFSSFIYMTTMNKCLLHLTWTIYRRYLRKVHSLYILWMCLSPGISAYAIWNIYKAGGNNLGAVQQGGQELSNKNCIG